VTSFLSELECVEVSSFCAFLENDKRSALIFFHDSGENACSLQPSLKNTAPGL